MTIRTGTSWSPGESSSDEPPGGRENKATREVTAGKFRCRRKVTHPFRGVSAPVANLDGIVERRRPANAPVAGKTANPRPRGGRLARTIETTCSRQPEKRGDRAQGGPKPGFRADP